MRHTSTETSQRYIDCLDLFLKQRGRNVSRIEREMRSLGHHNFTRRILYNRTENNHVRPGWIERFNWKELLAHTGGNATGREYVPPANTERGGSPKTPLLDRRGGGVLADGVVDPTRSGKHAVPKRELAVPPQCSTTPPSGHPSYPGGEFRSPAAPKSSPPSQGGVAAASADGVGTPGRLPSGRSCAAGRPSRPNRTARVSTTFGATPRHTTPSFPPFRVWLRRVSPNLRWDLPHLEYLYTHLKKISDGSCKRLMIFMPPRHGKSETVTVRYTAWRLSQDPAMNVILGSYNQRLANRFSRKIRRILADDASIQLKEKEAQSAGFSPSAGEATAATPGEQLRCGQAHTAKQRSHTNPCTCPTERRAEARTLYPFTHRPANSEAEWETAQGGGLRAVGVGSGVTGFGASLIVIDDPVKSRTEAESETYREKVWDWFNDDLYTRLEPNGAIILIQTRWHEDDLAGRLIKEMQDGGEHWEIVNLPALCEEPDADQHQLQERTATQSSLLTKEGCRRPRRRGGSLSRSQEAT